MLWGGGGFLSLSKAPVPRRRDAEGVAAPLRSAAGAPWSRLGVAGRAVRRLSGGATAASRGHPRQQDVSTGAGELGLGTRLRGVSGLVGFFPK